MFDSCFEIIIQTEKNSKIIVKSDCWHGIKGLHCTNIFRLLIQKMGKDWSVALTGTPQEHHLIQVPCRRAVAVSSTAALNKHLIITQPEDACRVRSCLWACDVH